jgi:uncharacterized protein (TIGR03437 family)
MRFRMFARSVLAAPLLFGAMFLFGCAAEAQNCTEDWVPNTTLIYIKVFPKGQTPQGGSPKGSIIINIANGRILYQVSGQPPVYIPPEDEKDIQSLLSTACGKQFAATRARRASASAASTSQRPAGQAAQATVIADFNDDGNPDSATLGSSGVTITLYKTDGTALGAHYYALSGNAEQLSLVTADFNGDGKADLAFPVSGASGGAGSVVVMLGNGDGTFANPVNFPLSIGPTVLALGDFNGDGKPDLAVAGGNVTSGVQTLALAVLLGAGDGTFHATPVTTSFVNTLSMVAVDVNGDGKTDLLVAANGGGLFTYPGHGDGTFGSGVQTPTNTNLPFLAYADLNSDGNIDAVLAEADQAALYVAFGKGDSTFQTPVIYAAPANAGTVGLVPLEDGTTAVLLADEIDGSTIFATANSSGVVELPAVEDVGPSTFFGSLGSPDIVAADLTGNGKSDLVITDPGDILVALNTGKGTFSAPASYPTSGGAVMTAVADLNGDGKPDLLFTDSSGVGVLLNQGSDTFSAGTTMPLGSSSTISVADFNGDGKPDFAVVQTNQSGGGTVAAMLGNGDGTFNAGQTITPPVGGGGLVTGDFNNDGKPDIVTGYSDLAAFYPGNGNGTFGTPVPLPIAGQVLAAGDVNGDGKLDVVIYNGQTDELYILLGNGGGTFKSSSPVPNLNTTVFSANIADVNGDGKLDLILGSCCGFGEPSVLFGNGDGTFAAPLYLIAGTDNPGWVAVGNFSGSGLGLAAAGFFGFSHDQATFSVFYSAPSTKVLSSANPNPAIGIAPGSLASVYGADLATSTPGSTSLPLPTTDAGSTVAIADSTGATTDAPLLYVSPGQINFEVPPNMATGLATVTVTSRDGTKSTAIATIASVAPGVFELNSAGLAAAYMILYHANGTQTVEQVYKVSGGAVVATPVSLGSSTDKPYLFLFGTGFQAAGTAGVKVSIGGTNVPVSFAGAQGGFVGLDQANVQLPAALAGKGDVIIQLTADGMAANPVNMTIQ